MQTVIILTHTAILHAAFSLVTAVYVNKPFLALILHSASHTALNQMSVTGGRVLRSELNLTKKNKKQPHFIYMCDVQASMSLMLRLIQLN